MEGKIGQLHFNLREKIDSNGSFGKTYKGTLNETADVAVKLVSKEEFDVDLEAIRQVNNHQHILSVYCSEEDILFM